MVESGTGLSLPWRRRPTLLRLDLPRKKYNCRARAKKDASAYCAGICSANFCVNPSHQKLIRPLSNQMLLLDAQIAGTPQP